MPTYLVHGFRWHRPQIRIHIILFNLENAAAEWIVADGSAQCLVNSFYALYDFLPPSPWHAKIPKERTESSMRNDLHNSTSQRANRCSTPSTIRPKAIAPVQTIPPPSFNDLSPVKLVEQYDPEDLVSISQPYAYIADHVVNISLSCCIRTTISEYEHMQHQSKESAHSFAGHQSPSTSSTPATSSTSTDEQLKEITASLAAPGAGLGEVRTESVHRKSETDENIPWIEKLRNKLQINEDVGWYVVVCGDEERLDGLYDSSVDDDEAYDEVYEEEGRPIALMHEARVPERSERRHEPTKPGRQPITNGQGSEAYLGGLARLPKAESSQSIEPRSPKSSKEKKVRGEPAGYGIRPVTSNREIDASPGQPRKLSKAGSSSSVEFKSPKNGKEKGLRKMKSFFGRKKS